MISKEQWIKELKVGDRVCDCRFEHLAIKGIVDDHVMWRPMLYWWITGLFPFKVQDWIDDGWDKLGRKLGIARLVDRTLVLENGSVCSAKHCCDPVEHDWDHILRGKNDE